MPQIKLLIALTTLVLLGLTYVWSRSTHVTGAGPGVVPGGECS